MPWGCWLLLERCVLDDGPEHVAIERRCSRRRRGPVPAVPPGSGAERAFVPASVRKCQRLQLLLNMGDFKLEKGNLKQKQGGHPGSLSLDYAIICWVRVTWKILHIFSDTC